VLLKSANFRINGNHHIELDEFNGSKQEVAIDIPNHAAKNRPPMIEPRSLSYRVLPQQTGYIRVATFPGAIDLDFAKGLDSIIRNFKDQAVQQLIVDLRSNISDGLGSLRLMSYLSPD